MRTERSFWALLAVLLSLTPLALAQDNNKLPVEVEGIEVVEHLDAQLPLDLPFVESDGTSIELGELFDGTRPVILTMNYSNCPKLCSLQLNGLFRGLDGLDWDLGHKYQMITLSIDPNESPERADLTKQKYLKVYGRPGVASGWHCLVGKEEQIKKLADTVGFGYNYDPETDTYGHAAVLMICTPDGRVSRYLGGIEYPTQDVRLALLEAADGRIGSAMDQLLLYCFRYDATRGRYGPAAIQIMKIGGTATLLFLGGMLVFFWRREAKRRVAKTAPPTEAHA